MNNESPMHKAFTSYMHDCGCNKSTTQLSNNEEDDILVWILVDKIIGHGEV